jgi:hypothetical protein
MIKRCKYGGGVAALKGGRDMLINPLQRTGIFPSHT